MAAVQVTESAITARAVVEYASGDDLQEKKTIVNVSAFIVGAKEIVQLQQYARLVGVPVGASTSSGDAPVLRLAIEEVAVGITHGYLKLAMEDESLVDAISIALRCLVASTDSSAVQDLFAITPLARLRVRVFADLWRRGHFVAFGSKFGVDFLLYKADPQSCHSFAVVVVKSYSAFFTTLDIVSHCRVAKMVKKQFLLASECGKDGDSREKIVYLSLDHAVLAATRHESR